jgi:hypothetical protein
MGGLVLALALGPSPDAPVRQARLLVDDAPLTRDGLSAELTRLDQNRPSFGAPIVLLSFGVGGLVFGGALSIIAINSLALKALLTPAMQTGSLVLLGIGAGVFLTGATLAIIGTILLIKRFTQLKAHHAEMEDIRKKLDGLNDAAPPPPVTLLTPVLTF